VALDFDPDVVDIVSQSFRLVWRDERASSGAMRRISWCG
jgi:hypothetical protein